MILKVPLVWYNLYELEIISLFNKSQLHSYCEYNELVENEEYYIKLNE